VRALAPVAALVASVALAGVYAGLGGASYEPAEVADPCAPRAWRAPEGAAESIEQVVLSALDGAACKLGASREELVLALRDTDSLREFARDHDLSDDEVEKAVRDGLVRAIDDAAQADAVDGATARVLREAAERLPLGFVLELLRGVSRLLPG
jgi:hypothetical protein